jgi:hypothetical protein
MSSSKLVAMTPAMAGCCARRLDAPLRGCRFTGTFVVCATGLRRNVLLALIARLAIHRFAESQAFVVWRYAGASAAGSRCMFSLPSTLRLIWQKLDVCNLKYIIVYNYGPLLGSAQTRYSHIGAITKQAKYLVSNCAGQSNYSNALGRRT